MLKKIKNKLAKITGVSTPLGGISWLPTTDNTVYDVEDEYYVAATVANEQGANDSFQMRTALSRKSSISELTRIVKFQLGVVRSSKRTGEPESFNPSEISDPTIFDWNCTQLSYSMNVSQIAHGRLVIAIFDSSIPPQKAAILTKEAIRDKLEVNDYLF